MEPKIELYKDEKGNVIDTTDDKSMLGGLVSRFMESPTVLHQNTVKRTMSIIACDVVDKKSTGGMAFYLDESILAFHGCSKHIDVRYHLIRECVEKGFIVIKHMSTEVQRADILTKPMSMDKFGRIRKFLGVKDLNHF
ncbi:uncharacterized protein LOC141707005 [Apium graveolens]|uniref:uncharacterized protein LOC141707005 n=1 Tax=Apium graveolens TaxID=4045 RepID=UPI003D78FE9C